MQSRLAVTLLALLSLAALLFTPMSVGFAIRPAFGCELVAGPKLWVDSIFNLRHLLSFSVLTVVAVWAFGTRRIWLAAIAVLVLTGLVEIEQMIFADGHCRLRNMLPNVIAIAAGVAIALLVARLARRRTATQAE